MIMIGLTVMPKILTENKLKCGIDKIHEYIATLMSEFNNLLNIVFVSCLYRLKVSLLSYRLAPKCLPGFLN